MTAQLIQMHRRTRDLVVVPRSTMTELAADVTALGMDMEHTSGLLYQAYWEEDARLNLYGCGRLNQHGKKAQRDGQRWQERIERLEAYCPDEIAEPGHGEAS